MGSLYERIGKPDEARKCYRRISLHRDDIARLLSPIGFLVIMVAGSIMMLKHGDKAFVSLVILSAIICLMAEARWRACVADDNKTEEVPVNSESRPARNLRCLRSVQRRCYHR